MSNLNNYGITVREALALPGMEDIRLIGGENGIENLILYLNVIEVPDIVNWVLEGEFLFTTGFPFLGEENFQDKLIPGLVKGGSAGLCIKPKRFIENIKPELISIANEHQFPLIEIPYHLSFSEVIGIISNAISNRHIYELKQREKVHTELTSLVLKGGTIDEVIKKSSKLINNKIIVVNENLEAITEVNSRDEIYHEELKKYSLNSSLKCSLYNKKGPLKYKIDEGKYLMLTSIEASGETYGYISLINKNKTLSVLQQIILEQTALVISLIMLKERQVTTMMQNYVNELIDDLLHNNNSAQLEDIHERVKDYGWELKGEIAIGLIEVDKDMTVNSNEEFKKNTLERIKKIFELKNIDSIVGIKRGFFIFLLQKRQLDELDLESLFEEIIDFFNNNFDANAYIGVGEWTKDYSLLNKSYDEAYNAIRIGRSLSNSPNKNYSIFSELRLYKMLYNNDLDYLEEYAHTYLNELLKYDEKYGTELLDTLENYFICQGNIKMLSEKLYIHYNTAIKRIKKIENLLNIELKNIEHQLNLYLSIKILNLIKNK